MELYHIGFSPADLGTNPPQAALLSGDPQRAKHIAETYFSNLRVLSENRGLNSYLGFLPNGEAVISATSGMGAPSLSIVVNELVQVGITTIIRVGTSGSIQPHLKVGSVVISQGALCRQGAANDIAPLEYPASADPFLTVAMVKGAQKLGVEYHLGITASVDTFYEGQERQTSSANRALLPWLQGITSSYQDLNILNYEMEAGTLFKMASVYGFKAACICAIIAQRTEDENVVKEKKAVAVENAIQVALEAVKSN